MSQFFNVQLLIFFISTQYNYHIRTYNLYIYSYLFISIFIHIFPAKSFNVFIIFRWKTFGCAISFHPPN